MLACFRFFLGLGMGGEWNTGATLVAETWPDELRARALSVVQSSWAIGYAAAALVSGIVLRRFDWRAVFFLGILPAFVTLWIRKDVPEPELWKARSAPEKPSVTGLAGLFSPEYVRATLTLLLMNFFGLFAWWGLFTWIPPYLSLPVSEGGRGFGVMSTTGLLVFLNLAGMFPGYLSFGWFADRLGRKRAFLFYLLCAAAIVPCYARARNPLALLVLGAAVAFFGTGFFSGSAIIGSEIFPTRIRARALGFTYNGARTLSALAPYVIGRVGQTHGLDWAFFLCAASFLVSGLLSTLLPETRGKALE
jgi:MFS family permease